ncbi:hypothetical protein KSP40_PGU006134 [Platanthera guangdongensis]|uniref:Core domain-containing protein n=1 Tax=Platanthera guangdongensis TaxID=2320717 RepID=A0ABR2MJ42_9ASPA
MRRRKKKRQGIPSIDDEARSSFIFLSMLVGCSSEAIHGFFNVEEEKKEDSNLSNPFPQSFLHELVSYCNMLLPAPSSGSIAPVISLSDKAFNHLNKMRVEKNEDLCLRIGVKQGGCSGMSYTMEFENRANTTSDDSLIEYNGVTIACDPKSLMYMYGMQLDFNDALVGGGFSFKNPNATKTCGCGKSFASGASVGAGAAVNVDESSENNRCGA